MIERVRGFRDSYPEDMLPRQKMFDVMRYVVANPGSHFTAEDIHQELMKTEPTIPMPV